MWDRDPVGPSILGFLTTARSLVSGFHFSSFAETSIVTIDSSEVEVDGRNVVGSDCSSTLFSASVLLDIYNYFNMILAYPSWLKIVENS